MILGRFRVEKNLGHGGMGEVLLAHDTLLNRRVALKRLHALNAEGTESEGRRNAILKEARRASQVSDRRIAAIYDVLELENDVLLVMEYVDGTTLRARMARPLPIGEFWDLATQCVEAVGAAHAHGVIHRDIKPENLMLTRGGEIKILDFGIARRAETPEGSPATFATTVTQNTGARAFDIAGTPQYMAPEAHYGGRIDERTDIFSLGTVFYELLTARSPFAGPTYEVVLQRVMNSTPEPVSDVNRAVAPELAAVIARMMAKDPAQRQASCDEVMKDLQRTHTLTGAGLPVEAAAAPAARPRKWASWPVAVTAAVLAAATSWTLWGGTAAIPTDRNLVVLPPTVVGTDEDFSAFALGATQMLSTRLRKQQDRAGFQVATFIEAFDEKLSSAADARKVLGVNLALLTTFEQRPDALHARLDLWDAARGQRIASRAVDEPISQPFVFLDHVHRDAARMLRLPERPGDAVTESGVRGAGTLRYLLQGIGRHRSATTLEQERRAVDDLELARNTEPGAATPPAWLASAQIKCFTLSNDRAWQERAESSARTAIGRDSSRAEPYRFLADALANARKNPDEALAAYQRARDLDPTDDYVALRLGRTYALLGQPEKEKEAYLATIAARPHCWQPYWWLANWYFRQGRFAESAVAYRDMVHRAPDLYRGYSSLGGILVYSAAYEQAIDTLKISIALRPSKVAFDNLGTAYFNSGRLQEAVDAYNQAFQFGFADYLSWMNFGDAYYWLPGHRGQATEAYGQAVRLGREAIRGREGKAPDHVIPAWLATIFPKLGQPDSARVYLASAIRSDSTNATIQYCAALTYWELAERSRAIHWIEKAVQNGYPALWLRDSPMFEDWRGEEAFRAIIAGAGPHPSTSPGKAGRT